MFKRIIKFIKENNEADLSQISSIPDDKEIVEGFKKKIKTLFKNLNKHELDTKSVNLVAGLKKIDFVCIAGLIFLTMPIGFLWLLPNFDMPLIAVLLFVIPSLWLAMLVFIWMTQVITVPLLLLIPYLNKFTVFGFFPHVFISSGALVLCISIVSWVYHGATAVGISILLILILGIVAGIKLIKNIK